MSHALLRDRFDQCVCPCFDLSFVISFHRSFLADFLQIPGSLVAVMCPPEDRAHSGEHPFLVDALRDSGRLVLYLGKLCRGGSGILGY